jgi:UPF0755 protein
MMERPWFFKTWAEPSGRPALSWMAMLGGALVSCLLFLALQVWWVLTPAPSIQSRSAVVEIPAHLSLVEVARRLDQAGVIRSPLGFVLLSVARGSARSLKAGEYEVPQGASTVAILSLLEGGKVLHHPVVLREGSTVAELARALEAERLAPAEEVLRVARDARFLQTLDIPAESVEGYLFPDTYQLVKGMAVEEMLARMVARMRDQVGPDILAQARGLDLTPHQLLTLASIIEREAAVAREMPLISAVFWNRLKRDMPLQADPTVQYAVDQERRRPITRADLQVDSPFNTYRRLGLPPAPIGNPGRAAIQAAVNPAPVNYLYFVSIDDRHHHFSSTLSDHNAAVARYRLSRPREGG